MVKYVLCGMNVNYEFDESCCEPWGMFENAEENVVVFVTGSWRRCTVLSDGGLEIYRSSVEAG
jgi:hypothetical protein